MTSSGWNVIDAEAGILTREYAFGGGGWATTLVFRAPEGLVVVSPATGLAPADYDALAAYGEVRALVASNALHHLGQTAWRTRFPQAESYAAPGALSALAKKAPAIPWRSVEALDLGPTAQAHVLEGYRHGEVLVSVQGSRGPVWYTGDLFTNIQRMPGPPVRWLFTWTGSAPGLRWFRLGAFFFVQDRPALRAQVTRLVDEAPPTILVPGHGPPVDDPDLANALRAQLARM